MRAVVDRSEKRGHASVGRGWPALLEAASSRTAHLHTSHRNKLNEVRMRRWLGSRRQQCVRSAKTRQIQKLTNARTNAALHAVEQPFNAGAIEKTACYNFTRPSTPQTSVQRCCTRLGLRSVVTTTQHTPCARAAAGHSNATSPPSCYLITQLHPRFTRLDTRIASGWHATTRTSFTRHVMLELEIPI